MSEGDLRWGTVVNVQIDEDFDAGSVQNTTTFVYWYGELPGIWSSGVVNLKHIVTGNNLHHLLS